MQIVYLFIAFVSGMTISNFEKISDEFLQIITYVSLFIYFLKLIVNYFYSSTLDYNILICRENDFFDKLIFLCIYRGEIK